MNSIRGVVAKSVGIALCAFFLLGCECGGGACKDCDPPTTSEARCDPSWRIQFDPAQSDVDAGSLVTLSSVFGSSPTEGTDVRIFYSVSVSPSTASVLPSPDKVYATPIPLEGEGGRVIQARFGCDPVTHVREQQVYNLRTYGELELSPAPGRYREPITVIVEYFPSSLTVYASRSKNGGSKELYLNARVPIPSDGQTYLLEVTATDIFGNVATSVSAHYEVNPDIPYVESVLAADSLHNQDVIQIVFDRPVTGALDPQNSDVFHIVPIGAHSIKLYPRFEIPAGEFRIKDYVRAFGEDGSLAEDPDQMLSVARQVCVCRPIPVSFVYPDYLQHFEFSPPVTVEFYSSYPLDPDSFAIEVVPLVGGEAQRRSVLEAELLEQSADSRRFIVDLGGFEFSMGLAYRLTLIAKGRHPLDPLGGAANFFTTDFGLHASAPFSDSLTVETANGMLVANHPLRLDTVDGWTWLDKNPYVLIPYQQSVYNYLATTVTDIEGATLLVGVPTTEATVAPSQTYRTLSIWPDSGIEYLRSWSELMWTVWLYDRTAYQFVGGSGEIVFSDSRTYMAFDLHFGSDRVVLRLPDGFANYPANSAELKVDFTLAHPEFGEQTYSTVVTYVIDSDLVIPVFDRTSWSWFGTEDTLTSEYWAQEGRIEILFSESVSAVTMAVQSPFIPSSIALSTLQPGAWGLTEPVSLGASPSAGIYDASLYIRNLSDVIVDKFDVPVPVTPYRDFVNPISDFVDQATDEHYVLQWDSYSGDLTTSAILMVQLMANAADTCFSGTNTPVLESVWPPDTTDVYIPVYNLEPGLYAICTALAVAPDDGFRAISWWTKKHLLQVQ